MLKSWAIVSGTRR